MSDTSLVAFPAPPDQIAEQRRDRELEHRMRALVEIARVAADRAALHETLAQRHDAHWLGPWEREKSQRVSEIARILADPEVHAVIRATPALRALFSANVPPPLPKRPRGKRRSRAKHVDVGLAGWAAWDWPKL